MTVITVSNYNVHIQSCAKIWWLQSQVILISTILLLFYIHTFCAIIVLCYWIVGISEFIRHRLMWLMNSPYLQRTYTSFKLGTKRIGLLRSLWLTNKNKHTLRLIYQQQKIFWGWLLHSSVIEITWLHKRKFCANDIDEINPNTSRNARSDYISPMHLQMYLCLLSLFHSVENSCCKLGTWGPSQYKDRLSQVWGFPC